MHLKLYLIFDILLIGFSGRCCNSICTSGMCISILLNLKRMTYLYASQNNNIVTSGVPPDCITKYTGLLNKQYLSPSQMRVGPTTNSLQVNALHCLVEQPILMSTIRVMLSYFALSFDSFTGRTSDICTSRLPTVQQIYSNQIYNVVLILHCCTVNTLILCNIKFHPRAVLVLENLWLRDHVTSQ